MHSDSGEHGVAQVSETEVIQTQKNIQKTNIKQEKILDRDILKTKYIDGMLNQSLKNQNHTDPYGLMKENIQTLA